MDEWISIEDKLPDKNEWYNIKGGDFDEGFYNKMYKGFFVESIQFSCVKVKATHWKPLVEYKG